MNLDDVFRVLEEEGVQKFVDSWDELTESVRTELEGQEVAGPPPPPHRSQARGAPQQGPPRPFYLEDEA